MTEPLIQIQQVGLYEAQARLTAIQMAAPLAPIRLVEKAADVLTQALKRAAPRRYRGEDDQGEHMADTIGHSIGDSPVGAMATWHASKVAEYVIRGTRPHDIWAGFYGGGGKGAHVLAFQANGSEVFTPYVRHPGTKPNDFRKKAWDEVRGEVYALLRESGRAVLRGDTLR